MTVHDKENPHAPSCLLITLARPQTAESLRVLAVPVAHSWLLRKLYGFIMELRTEAMPVMTDSCRNLWQAGQFTRFNSWEGRFSLYALWKSH